MPRKAKGPRLYLRERQHWTGKHWVIRDGGHEESTGCFADDVAGAEQALARYITAKHKAPKTGGQLDKTAVADVVLLYLEEHAPNTKSFDFIRHTAKPIAQWWGDKTLARVNAKTCAEYVAWRVVQGVSDQTARHDLKTLRAAIRYYHTSEYGPLLAIPTVTVPPRRPQRRNYWHTRSEAAARIKAARRLGLGHVLRMLLIGYYTGTRPGATMRLHWHPTPAGGWFDLETETLHRRPDDEPETKKRQPLARIHRRLMFFLCKWKGKDEAAGINCVIHWHGEPIKKLRRSWASVATEAGATRKDGPHIMRHTAATWLMQAGIDLYEAAGYLGMSVETLTDTYGHHHPSFQQNAARACGKKR
jgi:integrase